MLIRLMNWFQNLSLKQKLIIAFTPLISMVVLGSGLVIYQIAKNRLESMSEQLLQQNLVQTASLIDYKLDSYLLKSKIIFANPSLQALLKEQHGDFYSLYNAYMNVMGVLEPVLSEMTYSSSSESTAGNEMLNVTMYVHNETLAKDSGLLRNIGEVEGQQWLRELRLSPDKHQWRWLYEESGRRYISIDHLLISFSDLKELGVLTINIPEEVFQKILQTSNEDTRAELVLAGDTDDMLRGGSESSKAWSGNVVERLRNENQLGHPVKKTWIDGTPYFIASVKSGVTGWDVAAMMPYAMITDQLKPIGLVVTIILTLSLVLCFVTILFIAHLSTRRLHRMTRKMNRIQSNWNEPLPLIPGHDDIGQLDSALNKLVESLKTMSEERIQLQLQKSLLQVELLQAQINPHLLYNTLATIRWKAKRAGAEEISGVTEALIRFFKHFLNRGENMTTIGSELTMIKEYTKILRFTYHFDFHEDIQIEEELLACKIPHLLLQPFVENAVVHGLRPKKGRGHVKVHGRKADNAIQFLIEDDGIGVGEEQLSCINNAVPDKGGYSGYGLVNVRKRIQLCWGNHYGFAIESRSGAGTRITLRIPLPSTSLAQSEPGA
ncbi:cache domain-containing sensor histidine kinase [Paenibacillus chungangensis]|uniref:histidine kinase n=1 Tax=Paenibacillus chungangensis TaxID=696535 RepID=A0ABW3HLJ8_9BACL